MSASSNNDEDSGKIGIKIGFDEAESASTGTLPCSNICRTIFRHIRQLGDTDISEYRGYISADVLHKPWRDQVQPRAEFIARSARQLAAGKDPEDSTLPLILTSETMARLSVEVECDNGVAQLWFSKETDVEPHEQSEPSSQLPRRATTTKHDFYNLRMPDKGPIATKLLYQKWVFPFLILAAEPEAEDNDTSAGRLHQETIEKASQLLLSQEGLRQDAEETTEWGAGPLGWILSHRSNHWSVSACYMEGNDTDDCCIHILPLWSGSIDSPSRALQILLIIDYIVDWAREIYRKAILSSLAKASESKAKPVLHQIRTSRRFNQANPAVKKGPKTPPKDPLRNYETQYGVVRDARHVRSLFVALHVTEDNFSTLMAPLSVDARKTLAGSILKCLTEAWRVTREDLDAMEEMWTNKSRGDAELYPKDKIFLVVTTVTAYLTPSWEPTRELGYLAVAESLFDRLLEEAGLQRHPGRASVDFPKVMSGSVSCWYSMLKQCNAQDTLKACAARVCRHSGIEPMLSGEAGENSPNWRMVLSEMKAEGMRHRLDVVIKPAPASKARNIVFDLLMGQMAQVSSSLFRISSLLEELPRPGEPRDYPEPPGGDDCLWGFPPGLPDFEEKNVVLATAADSRRGRGDRDEELCIFVMDPTVLELGLPLATLLETHPDWHLRVKRFHRKHGWGARDGNLSDFICRDRSMEPKLAEYRKHLGASTAEGQQSPGGRHPSSPRGEEFWAGKRYASGMNVFSNEGIGFNFMDALNTVKVMRPGKRLSSIVWRNPPKDAETAIRIPINRDSNGNPTPPSVRARGSTTSGQQHASPGDDCTNTSPPPVIYVTDTSPEDQAGGASTSEAEVPRNTRQVIEIDSDSAGADPGPSKGKRPLWDGLPEHEPSALPGKRPRLSTPKQQQVLRDALSDVEFDMFMQAGVFT
ncbi:hypothetical protein GQ53DRAFT_852164 [Thozetella sp. PMI_491]|nr:hypothetical protein GQ53DRAFT_852164 [Thozetella sp. PMI_491]